MLKSFLRTLFSSKHGSLAQLAAERPSTSPRNAREATIERTDCTQTIPAFTDDIDESLLAQVRGFMERGESAAARSRLEEAISRNPRNAGAYFMRGSLFSAQRAFRAALRDYDRSLEIQPRSAAAHMCKGQMHFMLGEFEQALHCAHCVLELEPGNTEAQRNVGLMLRELGRLAEAEVTLRQNVALSPTDHDARCALAMVLIDLGRFEDADQHVRHVLDADAGYNEARWLKAISLLLRGNFRAGWEHYDSRLQREDAGACRYRFPQWDGGMLDGTLLIYAEQGLGDDILFSSCVADARRRVALCILECDSRLLSLFQRSFSGVTCVGTKHIAKPALLADNDAVSAQIAAGSLPALFRNELKDFPEHDGYLIADGAKVQQWKSRLAKLGPGLKVGISWTGGGIKTRRRARSLSLRDLLPVLNVPGAHFLSLQYVESSLEIEEMRVHHGIRVTHWQEAIDDYDETAALVCALDLVISVCTSVVHLAGALGKTAWVLVPATPEWRYLRSGERLPWYPTARLYRQVAADDWTPVVAAVSSELRNLINAREC